MTKRNKAKRAQATHGHSTKAGRTPEYITWCNMNQRCYYPKKDNYKHYGAKGIRVCARWLHGFENFLSDMGPRPPGMTLDRKDSNKNYTPKNCRWATHLEQQNNRGGNVLISHAGETKTISGWARHYKINFFLLHSRLSSGKMSFEEAVSSPPLQAKRFEFRGEALTLAELAARHGIKWNTLWTRLSKYGMSLEEAVLRPLQNNKKRKS